MATHLALNDEVIEQMGQMRFLRTKLRAFVG